MFFLRTDMPLFRVTSICSVLDLSRATCVLVLSPNPDSHAVSHAPFPITCGGLSHSPGRCQHDTCTHVILPASH